jgi:proline dehydrogenase
LEASISDKSIAGYTFTTNNPIVFRQASFEYYPTTNTESSVTLLVSAGPENDFKNLIGSPKKLVALYPQFSMDKMKHKISTFYTESQSNADLAAQLYAGATRPEAYKSIYKRIYN